MKKFKKYDKYKNTDIAWLNKIPSHWTEIPNRCFLTELKNKVGKNSSKYTLLSLTKNGVIIRDLSEMKGKFPAEFDSYKIVNKGNLILCLFDIEETPRTVGLSKFKGMITGAYNVLKIENVNPQFITYFYIALDNTKELRSLYRGLRKTIKIGKFLSIKTPIPPIDEQDKIVSFIEYKEKQINKLIKKQKKLIELLEEKKKIIITEAVTKGLDKSVPMKDSGIRSINDIPKHWEIYKIKSFFKFGKGLNITKEHLVESGIPVISYGQVHSKENTGTGLSNDLFRFVPETYLKNQKSLVNKGDFIFADTSEDLKGVGNAVFIDKQSTIFAGYHSIILRNKVNSYIFLRYLSFLFISDAWRQQLRTLVTGVKVYSINKKLLKEAIIFKPTEYEQKIIVEYLENKCKNYDKIIKNKENIIQKLEEYKKSLISFAVTGQIDVRDYEIPKIDDDIDLENIENISEDDTETISEVEYANN